MNKDFETIMKKQIEQMSYEVVEKNKIIWYNYIAIIKLIVLYCVDYIL